MASPPARQNSSVDLAGGCACGRHRYRTRGVPRDLTLCHCTDCRRASGAPAVAWVTFRASEIEWTLTPALRQSSPRAQRGFCPDCGTQLSFFLVAEPDAVDLTLCSLDDPEALAPEDHTYTRSRLSWLQTSDDWPRYATSRQG
jgi:hypothetical protein